MTLLQTPTATYRAAGMTCDHCVTAVTAEVGQVAGVTAVEVDLDSKLVHVHGESVDPQDIGVSQATATLHQRLDALGIPHLYVDYGPGAHTWPSWQDDLAATLPSIAAFFARAQDLPLAA